MDNLTELYCLMDDFYKIFEPRMQAHLLADGKKNAAALALCPWLNW